MSYTCEGGCDDLSGGGDVNPTKLIRQRRTCVLRGYCAAIGDSFQFRGITLWFAVGLAAKEGFKLIAFLFLFATKSGRESPWIR
jgi:hypothetical protein